MLGPYFRGLGKRKIDGCRQESDDDGDEEKEDVLTRPHRRAEEDPIAPKRRRITHLDAEIIPKFDPGKKSTNVKGWLHKIEQLGNLYDWDDRDKIFVMQVRLRGAAREWYDDLEDYAATWNTWKEQLIKAFPRSTEFVDRLEEMLARKKRENETMTSYYHDKMSLLKKCNIDGESAASCLIRGLPAELQANAKAFNCESPDQLYYGFLSSLENFKRVEGRTAEQMSGWRRGVSATRIGLPKLCYNCRKTGHEARECRASRCSICQCAGHVAAACWFAAGPSSRPPAPPLPPAQPQRPLTTQQNYGDKTKSAEADRRGTRPMQDGRM